ncbi:MAG: DUF86 domain-containing protein [Balneolaceae bacterium]|nr:DUF86 domain-containing protein [Balneolaceae bacterium]
MTAKDRDFLFYLEDMLESMRRIEKYTEDLSYEQFKESDLRTDAVVRNLEIIGEAANNIPEDISGSYPRIPWKKMYGLRNLIAHKYFGIDYENIWKIISKQMPDNIQDLEKAIEVEKAKKEEENSPVADDSEE